MKIKNRWIKLAILFTMLNIGLQFPYLRLSFYEPLRNALELNHADFGISMAIFGLISIFAYYPSGILADRFSARILCSVGSILTGLGGLYFATLPNNIITILLHVFWVFTIVLLSWSATMKMVRMMGTNEEQGKLFGIFESGRGIVTTITSFSLLYIFNQIGEDKLGVTVILTTYAVISIVLGLVIFFYFPDSVQGQENDYKTGKLSFSEVFEILKYPKVWISAFLIFCTYVSYAAQTYTASYLTNVYETSANTSVTISIIRTHICVAVGGLLGAWGSTYFKSATKTMIVGYVLILASLSLYFIIPKDPSYTYLVSANIILMAILIGGMRGIYLATIGDYYIPNSSAGTAVGLCSVIGYMPDVFIYTWIGSILDTNTSYSGFQQIFTIMGVSLLIGLCLAITLLRLIAKEKELNKELRTVS